MSIAGCLGLVEQLEAINLKLVKHSENCLWKKTGAKELKSLNGKSLEQLIKNNFEEEFNPKVTLLCLQESKVVSGIEASIEIEYLHICKNHHNRDRSVGKIM